MPGLADSDSMRQFIGDRGVGAFPHLVDANGIWSRFGVVQQRTYILINDDGTWRKTGYGALESDVVGLING